MTSNSEFGNISFDLPKNQSNVIKVIGVGGGGSNAINHMFKQGIKGVDFIVCNTDSQALQNSPVPNKIQLGVNLTEGLGAGANPDIGHQAAIESIGDIEKMLDSNTKMVFITAGMGGGTGTGAAPVIAQLAKEKEILTVGIVTLPFSFEGKIRQDQAKIGIEKLRKQVDSLIVINNNKLREVYGNLGFKAGFSKADEVLATASRGIAEVITHHYTQNIDLRDVKTVLFNSGTAIMGSSSSSGDNRAKEAIVAALDSPLLDDNKITGAKNVLLLIVSGTNEITMDEIAEINEHIQAEAGNNANIIMGVGEDESIGDAVAVTIIATGFNVEQQNEIINNEVKIIHSLEDEQKLVQDLTQKSVDFFQIKEETPIQVAANHRTDDKIVFELLDEKSQSSVESKIQDNDLIAMNEFIRNIDVSFEIVSPINKLDFENKRPPVNELKVFESFDISKDEQITFSFDIPVSKPEASLQTKEENKFLFDLSQDVLNLKVNEQVEFVPVTELNKDGIIKYSLEEYMETESELPQSKPAAKVVEDPIDSELDIQVKQVAAEYKDNVFTNKFDEVTPVDMTIEEILKFRADERRQKLKDFNYKFHNSQSRLEELEKQPAYMRSGVEFKDQTSQNNNSRMSLGTDSNDDIQLRSNNSFLHDNVD